MLFARVMVVAAVAVSIWHAAPLCAEEWTRFRGPNGSGISRPTTIPSQWSDSDRRWKAPLPGAGHGAPVVWGNRLFVQAERDRGEARLVLCLDVESGDALWTREFPSVGHRKHSANSFATSTPAVDEERVYVAWAVPEKITLLALDHDGKLAWEADLGPFQGGHGWGASPVVHGELVVLANDQDGPSSLVALDRRSGEIAWKFPRRTRRAGYATPCLYERPGRPAELIFTEWQQGITALEAGTGRLSWEIPVFGTSNERAIGSPIVAGDLVIANCGFATGRKHVVAVRPGESGKPDDVEEVFHLERGAPHCPTVLYHKERLYLWNDQGVVTCCDSRTGETIWQRRVGGNYLGSPVCVDDRLFCVSREGEVVVLATGDEFRELARNPLDEACHSTPAVAGGTMFIRTLSHLHAIGGR